MPPSGDHDRTVGEALRAVARRLADAGVETARLDARLLLAHALGVEAEVVLGYPERPLDRACADRLAALAAQRADRVPLSHILGRREFWSLDFRVGPDTLTPRPDSETVIETVLAARPDRAAPLRLLDLGTGSGCLLLALLREFLNASGLGVDASLAALDIARDNAARLGLAARAEMRLGDWCAGLAGPFDVIVANPPYIPTADIEGLDDEVRRFEPRAALDGGADGLDAYRRIMAGVEAVARPGALLVFEVGAGQAAAVCALIEASGLGAAGVECDLSGVERCVSVEIGKKRVGLSSEPD